jgi:hypothetical protein
MATTITVTETEILIISEIGPQGATGPQGPIGDVTPEATAAAAAAAASALAAEASATTATTQAGIATTQAGIATTKAGEANDSATAAENSYIAAQDAAVAAGGYSDLASTSADAAAASAVAAAASAIEADDDAQVASTSANDAVNSANSAAADAIAAAADRVQTGLDAVATAADAVATAADRVQTGLDVVAAAASAAAALASEEAAQVSANAASDAQNGCEAAQAAADASAGAANDSAVAAASSATAALNAIAGQFKGAAAGSAVPDTSTAAGDRYAITASGTSQSITWTVGDEARYNGTSGSWTRVAGIYIEVANLRAEIATRPASGYLYSDGTTANRAQIQVPGTRGNLAGAPLASWVGWVEVPSASSTAEIFGVSSSTTALASATAWSIGCAWLTNDLAIRANGATPATDFRTLTLTGLRTTYSGQRIWLEVRITTGTAAPVVRVNGAAIAGTYTDGAGTDPDWLSASLVATFHEVGYNWPAGVAPLGCWINAHLTDAESEAWRTTGRPPVWAVAGGGGTAIYTSDFSAGADNWSGGGTGTVTGNVDGIDGQDNWASSTPSGGGQYQFLVNGGLCYTAAYSRRNATIRVKGTVHNALASSITVYIGAGSVIQASRPSVVVAAGTTVPFDVTYFYPDGNDRGVAISTASGQPVGTIYLRDVQFFAVGALSLPGIQPILALDDTTDLGGNPARLLGMKPITSERRWRVSANTETNGNQQLLGGSFLDSALDVIDSIEQAPASGTPTTSVGSASGGAQYKASGALAAGINTPALVTRKTASANIWVASNAATAVRTTITGHRAI